MSQAKKHMISFSFANALTVSFEIVGSYSNTRVVIKIAKRTSVISGGVPRSVL